MVPSSVSKPSVSAVRVGFDTSYNIPRPPNTDLALATGVFGVLSSAAIIGLTVASSAAHGKSESGYFGLSAAVTQAITTPVVALGSASARDDAYDWGIAPGLRLLCWVGSAISLAFAAVLIIDNLNGKDVPPGFIAGAGGLGALSSIGLTVDVFKTISDAESDHALRLAEYQERKRED